MDLGLGNVENKGVDLTYLTFVWSPRVQPVAAVLYWLKDHNDYCKPLSHLSDVAGHYLTNNTIYLLKILLTDATLF